MPLKASMKERSGTESSVAKKIMSTKSFFYYFQKSLTAKSRSFIRMISKICINTRRSFSTTIAISPEV